MHPKAFIALVLVVLLAGGAAVFLRIKAERDFPLAEQLLEPRSRAIDRCYQLEARFPHQQVDLPGIVRFTETQNDPLLKRYGWLTAIAMPESRGHKVVWRNSTDDSVDITLIPDRPGYGMRFRLASRGDTLVGRAALTVDYAPSDLPFGAALATPVDCEGLVVHE